MGSALVPQLVSGIVQSAELFNFLKDWPSDSCMRSGSLTHVRSGTCLNDLLKLGPETIASLKYVKLSTLDPLIQTDDNLGPSI